MINNKINKNKNIIKNININILIYSNFLRWIEVN